MRSERICGLARYVLADALNPAMTAYSQWLERTLDDSSNRRISIAEAFLATDAILNLCFNVASGIRVHEKVIEKHINEELPFIGTENILMDAVRRGGNRQELHERIRRHSVAAGAVVKEQGLPNDLISRIAGDPAFGLTQDEIMKALSPEKYIGRAAEQVEEFIRDYVRPVLDRYPGLSDEGTDPKV
jgi:adenylosuccinate lyase